MDPRIKTILDYAILAPSGDNCQPWKVAVNGLTIELFNNPEQDHSLYNLNQRASLIAHGAFLENIRLAALSVGLHAHVTLLPDPDNLEHIASVMFCEGNVDVSALFRAIPQRHTNRKSYAPVKISDSQVRQWQELVGRPGEKIWVATSPRQISQLSGLLSMNDRLVFEVPALHHFLFDQIRWTDEEATKTGDGLDIQTLGLNAVDRNAFRFLKNWRLVAVLSRLGFARIIQLKAGKLIRSSSAIAIILIKDTEAIHCIEGGALWQRLLLQLAIEGLAAQPIAGLACLLQSEQDGLLQDRIAQRHLDQLSMTRRSLLGSLKADDSAVILVAFRIGLGPPVKRALRRPLRTFLLR